MKETRKTPHLFNTWCYEVFSSTKHYPAIFSCCISKAQSLFCTWNNLTLKPASETASADTLLPRAFVPEGKHMLLATNPSWLIHSLPWSEHATIAPCFTAKDKVETMSGRCFHYVSSCSNVFFQPAEAKGDNFFSGIPDKHVELALHWWDLLFACVWPIFLPFK